ncbi:MAG: hypothetical protein WC962_09780, partial [Phycisphaerae bacterium]
MDTALYKDALFCGMTANAFKLGTVLHLGWFWPRLTGCSLLYRGDNISEINLDRIIAVAQYDANEIQVPSRYIGMPHQNNSNVYYVVRRANSIGQIERTLSASVEASFDFAGDLSQPAPNGISDLKIEIINGDAIKLTWFYCPLQQQSPPVCFNIYYDAGTGQIDYQNPLAQIEYQGRIFYTFTSDSFAA